MNSEYYVCKFFNLMTHIIGNFTLTAIVNNKDTYHLNDREKIRSLATEFYDYNVYDFTINFKEKHVYVSMEK